ncbi:(2Fe-2S)-binding protein [Fodinicurvata fenggangensis]|uniref:(2Fe-2S)-binding protein n=1 Tax=Fodinicurvata fenggangensis TaxID=1121830 RepID=UPI002AC33C40|nr:(2Fe-2S)-binding protein [Fodinicurvata fenggangensis]
MTFEGQDITAQEGESVAAALLAAGITHLRQTPVSGHPRAPYCMMGACFDCLVNIDGVSNLQACVTPVREGMSVHSQVAEKDLLHEDG